MAATTNLAELGASQMSAVVGDPTSEVGSTPLGSNPMNLLLLGLAMVVAFKRVAIVKKVMRPTQRLTPKRMVKTIQAIDWRGMRKHLTAGGIFATSAITFQTLVKPAMEVSNFLPLGGWLALNIPILGRYFKKTIFNGKEELLEKHLS